MPGFAMSRTHQAYVAFTVALVAAACDGSNVTEPETQPQSAANGTPIDGSMNAITYAVIGDVPYGSNGAARFPTLIGSINDDPQLRRAVHLGDTKDGFSACSDEWSEFILDSFNDFKDPLIYTPGDNEWTDCHVNSAGNWNPLERLETIRDLFFNRPGQTLGGRGKRVMWQLWYPENQLWLESGVVFAAIHVVGSNNGLRPGTCYRPFDAACPSGTSPETSAMAAAREAEWEARDAANREWLNRAFDLAIRHGAVGVVIFCHGDMWFSGAGTGNQEFVELLATRSAEFGAPVLLFAGDTHNYRVDQPLVGDTKYGATDAPNLTQITVDRSIEADIVWVRLHVDPKFEYPFDWEEVTVTVE
jgi:hypothetical protein